MPVGFAIALAINPEAMQKFNSLIKEQKRTIIAGPHVIKSKSEMHQYVSSLVNDQQ